MQEKKYYQVNSIKILTIFKTFFSSCAQAGMEGKYFLNIYFDCGQNDIDTKHFNGNLQWEEIQEEEEDIAAYDDKTKFVMRYK